MPWLGRGTRNWGVLLLCLSLTACGGGGGGGDDNDGGTNGTGLPVLASVELRDPTPGIDQVFGSQVVILFNGNVVVGDGLDQRMASSAGAVHLFNSSTGTLINSIFGDNSGDELGLSGIVRLSNDNYVIVSEADDVGGFADAGSVILVDGITGNQIGTTIAGDNPADALGSSGVIALPNGIFVVVSERDDDGGLTDVGSVMLIDGATGAQIGTTLFGDNAGDMLGSAGVTIISGSNFVIISPEDDVPGQTNAGSVMLIDGSSGSQIGGTIEGSNANSRLGSGGVAALPNGNFVISSRSGVGRVQLVSNAAAPIGAAYVGDNSSDEFGSGGIAVLPNSNFLIVSPDDDVGAATDLGSVILVDGSTGSQIGVTLSGNAGEDRLGSNGVFALPNNHFVIASGEDDVAGIADAGSVSLYNGATGAQIGSTVGGDNPTDMLGFTGITVLANGNYVVSSAFDDVGGIRNAGTAILFDGDSGIQIGVILSGDNTDDNLGFSQGATALPNGNYVVASIEDDVDGVDDAGSIRLLNGSTGELISTFAGDIPGDQIGSDGNDRGVFNVPGGNYLVISTEDRKDDSPGDAVGSIMLFDGASGVAEGVKFGDEVGAIAGARVVVAPDESFYTIGLPLTDADSLENSGSVILLTP